MRNHIPTCICNTGFIGDPFAQCYRPSSKLFRKNTECSLIFGFIATPRPIEVVQPCNPSPCGINAEYSENRGAASCRCILDYVGNPYVECKPEFTINPECPRDKSCNNHKWRSLSGCLWCPCNLLSYQFSSLCVTQVTPEMLLVTHKNNNSFTKNSRTSGSLYSFTMWIRVLWRSFCCLDPCPGTCS